MAGKNAKRNKRTHMIMCPKNRCQCNLGFFKYEAFYMALGLLDTDGALFSKRGENILSHELAGMIERALN